MDMEQRIFGICLQRNRKGEHDEHTDFWYKEM